MDSGLGTVLIDLGLNSIDLGFMLVDLSSLG